VSIHKMECPQCKAVAWTIIGGRPVRAECQVCHLQVLRLSDGWHVIDDTIKKPQPEKDSLVGRIKKWLH
jgi:Zn finger protein HypA/HybF involved in hydrogenase expression